MAEALRDQVDALTGFSTTEDLALKDWFEAGIKEVINYMPPKLLKLCAAMQTFTSVAAGSEAETLNTGKLLSVLSTNTRCREIASDLKGRASDSSDILYATSTDPVFYVEANLINALPSGLSCKYEEVQYPTVTVASDTAIAIFPDEAEYLVVLYAAIKALHVLMNDKAGNTAITAAFLLVKAELDETQAICDKIDADLVLAKAEVVLAKAEATELATQTDNSSTFNTALAAMATELNKVDGIIAEASTEFDEAKNLSGAYNSGVFFVALPLLNIAVDQAATAADKFLTADSDSVFGDESTFLTGDSQLTRVKDALDQASDIINGNQPSATTDAFGAQNSEDIELVTSALNIVQSEIRRAQAHLTEWIAIGDMRAKEVDVALKEAQGYASEVQANAAAMQAFTGTGNAYLQEAQSYISQAQGYAAEVNARAGFSSAKTKAIQGHISTAQAYVSSAQGFGTEVQAKIGIANGYMAEINSRVSVDSVEYTWYEKQQAKLQADYDRGLMALSGRQFERSRAGA